MKYIVLDMEWNQASSTKYVDNLPMPLSGEIIQIGAVRLGNDCSIEDTLRLNIRPKYYTKLHSGVRRLTGITSDELRDGISFPDAVDKLRRWCGGEFRLFIWGFDDIAILGENLAIFGLDSSWIPPCYNLQYIYCAQTGSEKRQWTLASAAEHFGIVLDIPAHDALNDAMYTAALLQKLDVEKGVAEYSPDDLLTLDEQFKALTHRVIAGYLTKQEALASRRVTILHCPICHARLKYDRFLRQNKTKRIAQGFCPDHGDFLCRIQFVKCENGKWRVLKTVYEGSPETRAFYAAKLKAALEAEAKMAAFARHRSPRITEKKVT